MKAESAEDKALQLIAEFLQQARESKAKGMVARRRAPPAPSMSAEEPEDDGLDLEALVNVEVEGKDEAEEDDEKKRMVG